MKQNTSFLVEIVADDLTSATDSAAPFLAKGHAPLICRHRHDAIIATGGDTMSALIDRLSINRFVPTGEFEPGFSVGQVERPDGTPLILAMKAGGLAHSQHCFLPSAPYLAKRQRKVLPNDY